MTLAEGLHPFPSRTRKLSPPAPMVLRWQRRGRVGRRRIKIKKPRTFPGLFCILPVFQHPGPIRSRTAHEDPGTGERTVQQSPRFHLPAKTSHSSAGICQTMRRRCRLSYSSPHGTCSPACSLAPTGTNQPTQSSSARGEPAAPPLCNSRLRRRRARLPARRSGHVRRIDPSVRAGLKSSHFDRFKMLPLSL